MNAGMQAARGGEEFSPGVDTGIEGHLLAAAAGSESALAALYDVTHRKVYGMSLRILGDRALAEDAVVDVYTQVWKHASRFDAARGNGLSWILTLARSRAIDLKRHRTSRTRVEVDLELAAPRPCPGAGPEASALAEARARTVRRALERLPAAQRQAIEAAFYDGLTHTEIAEALGKPLGTVKSRLRLALVALREALADDGSLT
jgi:RNA polymerase sigma-70 factor (ECF subfamily)